MLDRSKVLIDLINNMETDSPVGAEIGVYKGRNADNILTHTDAFLYLIDPWDLEQYEGDDTGGCIAEGDQEQLKEAKKECKARMEEHSISHDYSIIQQDHREVELEEELDFIFLDGRHDLPGTFYQITNWYNSVKDGGLLIGHDYGYPEYNFKVQAVVNEMADLLGHETNLESGYVWWWQL